MASRTIAGFFDVATHRVLLDGFGGLQGDAQAVAALFADLADARTALADCRRWRNSGAGGRFRARRGHRLGDFDPKRARKTVWRANAR